MISNKTLESLMSKKDSLTIEISRTPREMIITDYAIMKAYAIEDLVRVIKGDVEWYGYLIAKKDNPEVIVDIKLVKSTNSSAHTAISPEDKAKLMQELKPDEIPCGWIHSHNSLYFEQFSGIDHNNMSTVLDFVAPCTKKMVRKKEKLFKNLKVLTEGSYTKKELEEEAICIITDKPVDSLKILDTEYEAFSYNLLIGKQGSKRWHHQNITKRKEGLLRGLVSEGSHNVSLKIAYTNTKLSLDDILRLKSEVNDKVQTNADWRGVVGCYLSTQTSITDEYDEKGVNEEKKQKTIVYTKSDETKQVTKEPTIESKVEDGAEENLEKENKREPPLFNKKLIKKIIKRFDNDPTHYSNGIDEMLEKAYRMNELIIRLVTKEYKKKSFFEKVKSLFKTKKEEDKTLITNTDAENQTEKNIIPQYLSSQEEEKRKHMKGD